MDQQQPDDSVNRSSIVPNGGPPGPALPGYGAVPPGTSPQPPPYPQGQWQQQPPPHPEPQPQPQWQQQPPPYGYQPQPIYVTQQVMAPAYTAMQQPKSMAIALILTFLFGPLGLFYASITGGVVMLIITFVIAIPTFGFGLLFTVPACMIWAAVATNNYNAALAAAPQHFTQNAR